MMPSRHPLVLCAAVLAAMVLMGSAGGRNAGVEPTDVLPCGLAVDGEVDFASASFTLRAVGPEGGYGLLRITWKETVGPGGVVYLPIAFDALGAWEQSWSLFDIATLPEFDLAFELVATLEATGAAPALQSAGVPVLDNVWGLRMLKSPGSLQGNPAGPGGSSSQVPLYEGLLQGPQTTASTAVIPIPNSVDTSGGHAAFATGPLWTLEGALPVN